MAFLRFLSLTRIKLGAEEALKKSVVTGEGEAVQDSTEGLGTGDAGGPGGEKTETTSPNFSPLLHSALFAEGGRGNSGEWAEGNLISRSVPRTGVAPAELERRRGGEEQHFEVMEG